MMKSLKFVLPILVPLFLVGLCFIPDTTERENQLLNVVSAVGTIGALLFLILDKIENVVDQRQMFWQGHLPYLTVSSPCDPSQNRCDINVLKNFDSYNDRGATYFSIVNFSKCNAHNITVQICVAADFSNSPIRQHFIDFLPVLSESMYELGDPNGVKYVYSKYHINPNTRQVLSDNVPAFLFSKFIVDRLHFMYLVLISFLFR